MGEHLEGGGSADVGPDAAVGKGFPLGAWVGEMRRRKAAGELDKEKVRALEQLPGWQWE